MPTAAAVTYSGNRLIPLKNPGAARKEHINLVAGTYAKGTVVGEVNATPGTYKAYATGNVDGSQNPTHILEYPCVVDGSGNVWLGDTSGSSDRGVSQKSAPAYRNGYFASEDLVGLDAGGLTKLNGRLTQGNLTTGRVMIGGV